MNTPAYMYVFLVDDDPLFLHALKHHLHKKLKTRIRLRVFSTGEACLSHLHQKPNLILLDYQLDPEEGRSMNGIEVLLKIRAARPDIPVVILSGNASLQTAVEAIKRGAYDFIEKNEGVYERATHLVEDAIQSGPPFGETGNFQLRAMNAASANQQFCKSLQGKSRTFFVPFFLPEKSGLKKHWTLQKKKKVRTRIMPVN
jgi:DNA-binding NtrC family response regulator